MAAEASTYLFIFRETAPERYEALSREERMQALARWNAWCDDLVRSVGTFLYGRRMYQTMMGWEADPAVFADTPVMADFARIWGSADKAVPYDHGGRRGAQGFPMSIHPQS